MAKPFEPRRQEIVGRVTDGEKVPNTALLKLAAHYQSDKQLGFKAVSKRKRPGWLVGSWEEPLVHGDDSTRSIILIDWGHQRSFPHQPGEYGLHRATTADNQLLVATRSDMSQLRRGPSHG
jgi:hypothetical protein